MVTNAAKALKGRFKVAMTGTPVENSLLDLWCIMDFCVPGLLGNAKSFAAKYQNPLKKEDTDLLALEKGKHAIPGSNLTISVEDSENGPLEKRNSESHYNNIDFQYCVKGTERFGIIDHVTSTPKDKYKKDVIHYNYDKERALFYDSTPDKFFIFFPGDWHIAKVNNNTEDQVIRVCVIKVEWKE